MRALLLIAFFCLLSGALQAQLTQTVRGRVTDQATQAGLPYAAVVIIGTEPLLGATTNDKGEFAITSVPLGRYTLKATYLGYEPALLPEILVTSGKEVVLAIALTESAVDMKEVVVQAQVKKDAPLNEMATVSARMLSVEEAKRYAGGFDDPARLASSFAGVASNISNNGIVIRGNAPKALQWKMEGVEIPNPNHFADLSAFGGGGITALSSQMLANSDFFTGAFPAEYSNALSGVFDIAMRTGNNNKREHTFQLGAIGIDLSSEGPFKKGGGSSYLFNYRYSTLSLLTPLLPEDAGGTKYQDLAFKLHFPTSKAGVFSVWGIGLADRSGAQAETDTTLWKYDQDKERQGVMQYMAAGGLSHSLLIHNKNLLKTTLAATANGLNYTTDRMNDQIQLRPKNNIENTTWNLVLTSALQSKFSARHTNKTGIILTGLGYNFLMQEAPAIGSPLVTEVDQAGNSALLSAYSSSAIQLPARLTMNIGLATQLFTLNGHYTIEPRLGLKWQLDTRQSLAAAYGQHSRLERLNYYFSRPPGSSEGVNKDLDFTKAQHWVLGYDLSLGNGLHIRCEPYYQYLYNVPVIADSSFSFINLQNEWFMTSRLQNTGTGKNLGLDLTLEKYLSRGYYYMFTASVFRSRYRAGDGVWRNTLYDRNFVLNLLMGKEWALGKQKQNMLGANARFTYQGGDRYTPVDTEASLLARRVIYDHSQAFASQQPASFVAHFTFSYKINRPKIAHEIALKIINATMYQEFFGYRYNYIDHTIDANREATFIPNISYKIEF